MEGYIEVVVPQKLTFELQVKRFLFTVLPMFAGLVLLMYSLGQSYFPLAFIAFAVLFYISYRLFLNYYFEWEYTFVTNEVSFAKVMNKSKRKDIITCQLKDTLILIKSDDEEHIKEIPTDVKKYEFLSGTGAEHYIWVTRSEKGNAVCIAFEPTEELLNNMCRLARGKSFI